MITITEQNKQAAFDAAKNGATTLQVLEALFSNGEPVPDNRPITERVKSFEDACKITGDDPTMILPYPGDNDFEEAMNAVAMLFVICRALNEGWKPDWTNSNQPKYWPWFDMFSGSGLSCLGCDHCYSLSGVGSRLCFKTSDLAEYAGKQFKSIYEKFFILK